jgi:hypothetical protein
MSVMIRGCPSVRPVPRTRQGPGSGRGRLRRSGPPRPGTDRPAGHGKADTSLGRRPPACKARSGEIVTCECSEWCRSGPLGVVRSCPLGTGRDRCEWHAGGTADEINPSTRVRRCSQPRPWVRPILGNHCLVGKPLPTARQRLPVPFLRWWSASDDREQLPGTLNALQRLRSTIVQGDVGAHN